MSQIFEDLMQGLGEVEQYIKGERRGFKTHVPSSVDVKALRAKLGMSQGEFAGTFGFSVDAVRHWEARRRTPEASARAFLKVIAANPQIVIAALAAAPEAVLDVQPGSSEEQART